MRRLRSRLVPNLIQDVRRHCAVVAARAQWVQIDAGAARYGGGTSGLRELGTWLGERTATQAIASAGGSAQRLVGQLVDAMPAYAAWGCSSAPRSPSTTSCWPAWRASATSTG